jgi:hypothetical protein
MTLMVSFFITDGETSLKILVKHEAYQIVQVELNKIYISILISLIRVQLDGIVFVVINVCNTLLSFSVGLKLASCYT